MPQNTTAVQRVKSPIKFDMPGFEGDSAASWLTWIQKVLYQARACGFEGELTAAEGEGLSVEAGVFYRRNVDPVRLRNAHLAWMTLIKSCRGMPFKIMQRSEAPNNAWRHVKSHYRLKGTRKILRLSHEIVGKTMEPGGYLFKFMMEIDMLAADLY